MSKRSTYEAYSERELITTILSGNEEAAIYLIYNRYYKDLRYLCFNYCGSHEYIDDLCHEVYLLLKGKNGDWQPLSTWSGLSSFRTWLNSSVQHWLLKKRELLIGLRGNELYSSEEPIEVAAKEDAEANMNKVLLLEAIRRLKNAEQRLVILKELQGYSHKEIAVILNQIRRAENRIKRNSNGEEILANSATIDVLKQRAIANLRQLLGTNIK